MKIKNIDWKRMLQDDIEYDEYLSEEKTASRHACHKQHPQFEQETEDQKRWMSKRNTRPLRRDKRSMIDRDNQ